MTLDDKNQMISYILVKTQSESVSILEKVKQDEIFAKLGKELSIDKGSEQRKYIVPDRQNSITRECMI